MGELHFQGALDELGNLLSMAMINSDGLINCTEEYIAAIISVVLHMEGLSQP